MGEKYNYYEYKGTLEERYKEFKDRNKDWLRIPILVRGIIMGLDGDELTDFQTDEALRIISDSKKD